GVGRAEHHRVQHPGYGHVLDEPAGAADEPIAAESWMRFADHARDPIIGGPALVLARTPACRPRSRGRWPSPRVGSAKVADGMLTTAATAIAAAAAILELNAGRGTPSRARSPVAPCRPCWPAPRASRSIPPPSGGRRPPPPLARRRRARDSGSDSP